MEATIDFKKFLDENSEKPLRDAIYMAVKLIILEGLFVPGERITEDLLANKFECSRTPVREALRKLENEGLLKVKPGVGMEISKIDEEMVEQEFELRKILEIYAVEKACEKISDVQIKRLEWSTDKIESCLKENDFIGATQANIEFHEQLLDFTGNRFFKKIKDMLWVSMRLSFLASRSEVHVAEGPWDDQRLVEHRDLIESLRNRDKASCVAITASHIDFSYQYYLSYVKQRGDANL